MLKKKLQEGETLLEKAILFASEIHRGTLRASGEPYITHPLAVKDKLASYQFPEKILCAAVLHDVLEDTNNYEETEKKLYEDFGDEVFFLVEAVSKDNTIVDKHLRDEKYQEQILMAMKRDPAIIFLKAADLLHNVSTLKYLSKEKQHRWISELKNFYLVNFLKNFSIIPSFLRDSYHELMSQIEKVVETHKSG